MRKLLFLALGVVASLGLQACLGNCAAICATGITFTVKDSAGLPLTPVSGTWSMHGQAPLAFDCGGNTAPDGGYAAFATCSSGSLTLHDFGEGAVALSFTTVEGKSFSGSATPTYSKTGAQVCGTPCEVGSGSIVVP